DGECRGTDVVCPDCQSCDPANGACVGDPTQNNLSCSTAQVPVNGRCCSGVCTSITASPNCGACGVTCPMGQSCIADTNGDYLCRDTNCPFPGPKQSVDYYEQEEPTDEDKDGCIRGAC